MPTKTPHGNPVYELAQQAADGGLVPVASIALTIPPGCLLDALGITLTDVGRGRARASMRIEDVHLNQRGIVQAGAIVSLADAVAGWASYAALPEGRFTTLELKCNMLGRAESGSDLVALARPVHLGRRTLVLDVDVFRADQEGAAAPRLTARFSCTQLVLTSEG
jgi:1,4-dihydroxy-2-naphthoyl-CoA hydrolase